MTETLGTPDQVRIIELELEVERLKLELERIKKNV